MTGWRRGACRRTLFHLEHHRFSFMKPYHDLLQQVLQQGVRQPNRTGVDAISLPGAMMKFDLRDGFPAVTTKKLAFGAVKGELIGFFRGYTNAADFRALGCKVWDQNANETASWVSNPARKGVDDLGRIYGAQWIDWREHKVVKTWDEAARLVLKGYEVVASDPERGYVMGRGVNQLEDALRTLLTNPTSRRVIVSAWRPDELDQMALPPCHVSYQFIATESTRELHLCMYQRSADLFLGVPFNIASSAMFLEIMARLSGFKAATFTHFLADAHIYVNHIDQVNEQLSREPFAPPHLQLAQSIKKVGLDQIKGAFERIEPAEIELVGYQCHSAIKAEMAA